MLRFLGSLFSPDSSRTGGLDETLIGAAIERAVDGTDRRLRALGNYRKRLREPVERAAGHVIDLVDALPPPAEISAQAFGNDARVRAFFSSCEHLREVLGGLNNLRDYLEGCSGTAPDRIFGLLAMAMEERSVLGMAIEGDAIRRDVLQIAVNFFHHRYLGPAGTEADVRWELKKRAFDFLIEQALQRLAGEKQKRGELERQRVLLRQKLAAMKAGKWGLWAMSDNGNGCCPDLAALEAEIAAIDADLGQCGTPALGLEESLDTIADTLSRPDDWLAAREIRLRLDYRGIKVAEPADAPELQLSELFSGTGIRRIVLLGYIPRDEIPEPRDFLKETRRYLV